MKRQLSDALILRFAYEYATDHNQRKAALTIGYSEKQATRMGYYLRHKPEVAKKIGEIENDLFAKGGATPEKRAFVMGAIAVGDIRGVCNWENNVLTVKDSSVLTDAEAKTIKKVKMEEDTIVLKDGATKTTRRIELEMRDAIAANEFISRRQGEFPKDPATPINIPILVIHSKAEQANGG